MLLRRCTQGLCLVCFIILSGALVLDNMAFLLAGGTLAVAITGQYLIFDMRLRSILASTVVRRSVSRNPVRKGTPLQVASEFTTSAPHGMTVMITDLPPVHTTVIEGERTITAAAGTGPGESGCRYRILPLVHGDLEFQGISVQVQNIFFSTTIRVSRPAECEPVLAVLPTGYFAAPSSDAAEGALESRRASVWSGIDVHSLREYHPGDDLRHADWKISAKYDKIFIRKYSAPMSHPPLIIADLPWIGSPYPEKEFGRMVAEVAGMAKHTIQTYQHVSVLIISGPNVLHLIHEEKNATRCIAEVREWMTPQERPVHFYRMADRADLRSRIRNSESALAGSDNPETTGFLEVLHARYNRIIGHQRNPAFSGQVARALAQVVMNEAYIFTLACGDSSHIQHVVRPLRTRKVRVYVKVVDASHRSTYSPQEPERPGPEAQP